MSSVIQKIQNKAQGNIAVLLGGFSAEREVSLKSGAAVVDALKSQGLDVIALDPKEENLVNAIQEKNIKHVMISLHGGDGEDGTVQGVLETLGVTYTGSGVLGSALAMDKMRSKQLWQGLGVSTADYVSLHEGSDWQAEIERLGGRCIVKPSQEGSSIGMQIAQSADDLKQAFLDARQYGTDVMAERWIEGPEYTVAIMGEEALPVIKLETDHGFYDFEAKYLVDDTRYICPCGLPEKEEQAMQALALSAFQSLACSGWGRVDVMRDTASQKFYVLEVNTSPGMTDHSLVPMAAKAKGVDFATLTATILADSMGAL